MNKEESKVELLSSSCGSGLKGRVFKAEQKGLNRFVAVKFVKDEFGGSAVAQGERLAKLAPHPNVVTVYFLDELIDPVDDKLRDALVMEWLDGQKLGELLGKIIPLRGAERICRGIISGVRHFHDSGVSHSDLHDGNVLILKRFVPKIIDADEERYAAFMQLSNGSMEKAKNEDLQCCSTLVLNVCRSSELCFNEVMQKQDEFRNAKSLDEIEGLIHELFNSEADSPNSSETDLNLANVDAVRSEFCKRVSDGNFWGLEQIHGAVIVCVVPEQENVFAFEDLQKCRLQTITGGWSRESRAEAVASISKENSVIKSVVEIDLKGTLLSADLFLLGQKFCENKHLVIPSVAFKKNVICATENYLNALVKLGCSGRVSIAVSLTNILDHTLSSDQFRPLDDKVNPGISEMHPGSVSLKLPEELGLDEVGSSLRPIFDHVWREFGLSACSLYE